MCGDLSAPLNRIVSTSDPRLISPNTSTPFVFTNMSLFCSERSKMVFNGNNSMNSLLVTFYVCLKPWFCLMPRSFFMNLITFMIT